MSPRIHRATAVALASLLVIGLSSCSSDDRLSKAELTSKLNSLCVTRDKNTKFLDNVNVFNLDDGAKAWKKAKPRFQSFVDGIDDLDPPKDAQKVVDGYVTVSQKAVKNLDRQIAAAESGNQKQYNQLLVESITTTEDADRTVADYGAKKCFNENEAFPPEQPPAAGATKIDVSAKEYTFTIPTGIKAGKTAFTMTNNGNEIHVFGYGRLKDGVTFEQLKKAATTSDQDPGLFDDEGVSGLAAPDGTTVVNVDLRPGTYVAYCFISAPDGVEHLKKGMLVPFQVS